MEQRQKNGCSHNIYESHSLRLPDSLLHEFHRRCHSYTRRSNGDDQTMTPSFRNNHKAATTKKRQKKGIL